MKRTFGFAFFALFMIAVLVFSVANFVTPAQAGEWVYWGTVTDLGEIQPWNEWAHLYGTFYCLYEESNCCNILN